MNLSRSEISKLSEPFHTDGLAWSWSWWQLCHFWKVSYMHLILKFLKWNNLPSIFRLSVIILEISKWNFKLASQQCRAWTDCMDVQAGLALYWLQRLITFGSSRIRVIYFFWTILKFLKVLYSFIDEINQGVRAKNV